MNDQHGIEVSGEFSPFLRVCIGVAIVCLAAAPLVWCICKGLAVLLPALR